MSSYPNSLYALMLDSSLDNKEEFSLFLKEIFIETINIYLKLQRENEDFKEKYSFILTALPVDGQKSNEDSNILFYTSPMAEEVPEDSKKLIEGLEMLNPLLSLEEDKEPELEITLTINQIVEAVLFSLRLFKYTVDQQIYFYWGIPFNTWFPNIPVYLETIMRVVDFGTPENKPLNLFYPIFRNLRSNTDFYYDKFLRKKEEKDANNTEL